MIHRTARANVWGHPLFLVLPGVAMVPSGFGQPASTAIILENAFERDELDPSKVQIGNHWGTNSLSRARGAKQADLVDGAMKITRAEAADHGVSVTHDVAFCDALITFRFKLGRDRLDLPYFPA